MERRLRAGSWDRGCCCCWGCRAWEVKVAAVATQRRPSRCAATRSWRPGSRPSASRIVRRPCQQAAAQQRSSLVVPEACPVPAAVQPCGESRLSASNRCPTHHLAPHSAAPSWVAVGGNRVALEAARSAEVDFPTRSPLRTRRAGRRTGADHPYDLASLSDKVMVATGMFASLSTRSARTEGAVCRPGNVPPRSEIGFGGPDKDG